MSGALCCQELTLTRGHRSVLNALTLSFGQGESWMILGENGVGKSTLLSALAGWLPPGAGTIWLGDQQLMALPPRTRARQIAWLTQQDDYPFPETVRQRALSGRYPYQTRWQMDSIADLQRVETVLAELDLADLADRDLGQLSGGERRRASLAAALVQDTPYLLLDEPMSQLDIRHQTQLLDVFQRLREQEKTLIVVGHDPNHALAFATHALLLFDGGCWLAGPVDQVLTAENLTRVYHTPIETWMQDARRWFVPCR